jgi:hypothetical protein
MSTANKPRDAAKSAAPVDASVPTYRVTGARHYINGRRYEVGATVAYSGTPGEGLEPINEAAKKAKAEAGKKK